MATIGSVDQDERALTLLYDLVGQGVDLPQALSQSISQFPSSAAFLADAAIMAANRSALVDNEAQVLVSSASRRMASSRSPMPIRSIRQTLIATKQTVSDVVTAIRISRQIFAKLEKRLIDPQTVPELLIADLADIIGETPRRLLDYLSLPMLLPAEPKSTSRPFIEGRQSFAEVVNTSKESGEIDQGTWEYWQKQIRIGTAAGDG